MAIFFRLRIFIVVAFYNYIFIRWQCAWTWVRQRVCDCVCACVCQYFMFSHRAHTVNIIFIASRVWVCCESRFFFFFHSQLVCVCVFFLFYSLYLLCESVFCRWIYAIRMVLHYLIFFSIDSLYSIDDRAHTKFIYIYRHKLQASGRFIAFSHTSVRVTMLFCHLN